MYYAPHQLYVKQTEIARDEYNRPIKGGEEWLSVSKCRCDDNNNQEIKTEEGKVFRPKYHIVCPKGTPIECGDDIRVMSGNTIRGEGRVINVKHLNALAYSEIWV